MTAVLRQCLHRIPIASVTVESPSCDGHLLSPLPDSEIPPASLFREFEFPVQTQRPSLIDTLSTTIRAASVKSDGCIDSPPQ